MPIPDAVAGPQDRVVQPDDPMNKLVGKVQAAANAALSGEITLDEWEATIEIITGGK